MCDLNAVSMIMLWLEYIVGLPCGVLPPTRPRWDRVRWAMASFGALPLGNSMPCWNVFLSMFFWKIT